MELDRFPALWGKCSTVRYTALTRPVLNTVKHAFRRKIVLLITLIIPFSTWIITYNSKSPTSNCRKWPPSNIRDLVVKETGILDLTLRPSVKRQRDKMLESDIHYSLLRKLYTGNATGSNSFENIALIDSAVRIRGYTPDFNLYPQVMDMRKTVAAVKFGEPVDEAPINDPDVLVITSPIATCQSKHLRSEKFTYPLDLVVIIKSCVLCFENRKRARTTFMPRKMWGGFRIQFMFVVGLPHILPSSLLTIDGVRITYRHARLTNRTQLKAARERLFRESSEYGDLLIGGFRDSYYNLTLKLILTFRWASVFCLSQTPIFLFMDDDFAVIPANVAAFVHRLSTEEKLHLIGGLPYVVKGPHRPSANPGANKWATTREQYPWTSYPSYLFGGAYMVGSDRVGDAAIAVAFTKTYHIDDTFLGLVWSKLHYFPLKIPGFVLRINPKSDVNKTIASLHYSIANYFNWNSSVYWVKGR